MRLIPDISIIKTTGVHPGLSSNITFCLSDVSSYKRPLEERPNENFAVIFDSTNSTFPPLVLWIDKRQTDKGLS